MFKNDNEYLESGISNSKEIPTIPFNISFPVL